MCFDVHSSVDMFIIVVFYNFEFSFLQNLSQQSDIVDLLGGFKPIDATHMCTMLYNEFHDLARNSKMKVSQI